MKSIFILILLSFSIFSLISISQVPTGISNHNGPIYTNAVLGFANITSLKAYNENCTSAPYGASLQLNVMLKVVNNNNDVYYFWLQNVPSFITNESLMCFVDNIWNTTLPYASMENASGKGEIITPFIINPFGPPQQSVYVYRTFLSKYSLPLSFYLLINETYNSSGVTINFGYLTIQNGSYVKPEWNIYDTVFIPINGVISASIIVNDSCTPAANYSSLFYPYEYKGYLLDAELVWGGFGNGESTYFLDMNSYLAMYYNENNIWTPFSTVYSYGNDTAESADNLQVSIANNGYAHVTTGLLNPSLVTTNFNPPTPSFTFLNISSPFPFTINGTLTKSFIGYIYGKTNIQFTINYTISKYEFAVLNGENSLTIYPTSNKVEAYLIIPNYTYYYYIKVNSIIPVYAIINGQNKTLNSGWYNNGTKIQIENITYYQTHEVRLVITNVYPSNIIYINSPLNITISTQKQYLVTLNTTIPVYAIINGQNKTLNSGWYNNGTKIQIENITYYQTSNTRYIITGISPNTTIQINNPINITITTQKQYLVIVNSQYPITINGESTSILWVPAGSQITINANLPFYYVGQLVGTYNINLGESISVNQPISETLEVSINMIFIGLVIGILLIASIVPITIKRKRNKGKMNTNNPLFTTSTSPTVNIYGYGSIWSNGYSQIQVISQTQGRILGAYLQGIPAFFISQNFITLGNNYITLQFNVPNGMLIPNQRYIITLRIEGNIDIPIYVTCAG